ncbi:MAG TPA: oligosaccharide flippase family protein [Pyrinomonadaceae bacterium]|nr:oligosaccharide flippase family protein [Pyrinomonadaceae bacterium]
MRTRSGKLILNSLYSVAGWMAPILLGLLATPIILKHLGTESYGIYLVILGFIGYSFTLNVARSVAKFVAEYRSSGDVERINSAITTAFWLNLAVGVVGAVIIGLCAKWIVVDILEISEQYQAAATLALIIGGISIPATLIGHIFQSILQGEHSFGALSVITNVGSLLINGGNVLLAVTGFGIDALILWTLTVAVIIAIISFSTARKVAPDLGLTRVVSREMIRPVVSYGSSIYVYQLCGGVLLLFERALVMRKFGGEAASYYIVPMTLAIYFHGFVSSLLLAAFPAMNELLSDEGRLVFLYKKLTKVIIGLTAPFLITVLLGGRLFLSLWIDEGFAANAYWLFVIHAATFGTMVLMLAVWQLNETFNFASLNAGVTLVASVVAIILMLYTADRWQEEGVAASRLIGVILTLPIIFYSERRFLADSRGSEWISTFFRVLPAVAIFVIVEYLFFTYMGKNWPTLIGGTLIGMAGYVAVLLVTRFITDDEKDIILKFLKVRRASA